MNLSLQRARVDYTLERSVVYHRPPIYRDQHPESSELIYTFRTVGRSWSTRKKHIAPSWQIPQVQPADNHCTTVTPKTLTGYELYRVPCNVAGHTAVLHKNRSLTHK